MRPAPIASEPGEPGPESFLACKYQKGNNEHHIACSRIYTPCKTTVCPNMDRYIQNPSMTKPMKYHDDHYSSSGHVDMAASGEMTSISKHL